MILGEPSRAAAADALVEAIITAMLPDCLQSRIAGFAQLPGINASQADEFFNAWNACALAPSVRPNSTGAIRNRMPAVMGMY